MKIQTLFLFFLTVLSLVNLYISVKSKNILVAIFFGLCAMLCSWIAGYMIGRMDLVLTFWVNG